MNITNPDNFAQLKEKHMWFSGIDWKRFVEQLWQTFPITLKVV
jgi:hypothetical protein